MVMPKTPKPLQDRASFEGLLEEPLAIIFKHSTACPISARAERETQKFLESNPDRKVYRVLVIEDRDVSNYIEDRTGVRHASPQVLVLREGKVVWHDSHFGVTAEAIASRAGSSA